MCQQEEPFRNATRKRVKLEVIILPYKMVASVVLAGISLDTMTCMELRQVVKMVVGAT